jgi:Holliday junction resolvase RusA-like endonuclease
MNELTFTVPGRPVPKARPRVTRRGTYTPKRSAAYEALVARAAWCAGVSIITAPIRLMVLARFKVAKSWPAKIREGRICGPHTQRPDGDNILKAIKDALNGVAYADDALVWSATIEKIWDVDDGAEVTLRW